VTHKSKGSDDGVIVSDPAGEKFRIRWAKRGTLLRNGPAAWDGTVSGLVAATAVTVLGKAVASDQPLPSTRSAVLRLRRDPAAFMRDGPACVPLGTCFGVGSSGQSGGSTCGAGHAG
jgi:hypothetical protein